MHRRLRNLPGIIKNTDTKNHGTTLGAEMLNLAWFVSMLHASCKLVAELPPRALRARRRSSRGWALNTRLQREYGLETASAGGTSQQPCSKNDDVPS